MRRNNFKISPEFSLDFEKALERDEVSSRGRSHWITQAFYHLLLEDPNLETVGVGESNETFSIPINWDCPYATQRKLEEAIAQVTRSDPMIGPAKSTIIRAALRNMVYREAT